MSAFHAAFGGNTRQMAAVLGVSQRSAQRYYTGGKEQRSPSLSTRAKMARHIGAQARVQGQFYFDTPGFRSSPDTRDRDIHFDISPQDMARVQDALAAGNDDLANEIFFEACGMAAPDDVIGAAYKLSPQR